MGVGVHKMKRHEALKDLSRDHYEVLILCQQVAKALEGDDAAPDVGEAAQDLVDAWDADVAAHFREEEDVLLPPLAGHGPVTEHPEVRRMLDDHAWFRHAIPRLQRAIRDGGDVAELAGEVASRLRDHARHEERELFEMLQETLTEEELRGIGEGSRDHRLRHRGEAALGPDRPQPRWLP